MFCSTIEYSGVRLPWQMQQTGPSRGWDQGFALDANVNSVWPYCCTSIVPVSLCRQWRFDEVDGVLVKYWWREVKVLMTFWWRFNRVLVTVSCRFDTFWWHFHAVLITSFHDILMALFYASRTTAGTREMRTSSLPREEQASKRVSPGWVGNRYFDIFAAATLWRTTS